MKKSKVEALFKWWYSMHLINVIISEEWLSLAVKQKEVQVK